MKFRKKPVVIEAIQWKGNNWEELEEFGSEEDIMLNLDETLTIATLEGNHTANKGDWIIRGIKGEIYPCKPDIFEQTYEAEEEKSLCPYCECMTRTINNKVKRCGKCGNFK